MLTLKLVVLLFITALSSDANRHDGCRQTRHHHGKDNKQRTFADYIDLSYSFNEDTIYFPGSREFSLRKDYDGVNKSGIWYSAFSFCMGEHGGTHIDAPFHFYKEGWTLEKIPPSHLIEVSAVVIDVQNIVTGSSSPNWVLNVSHLIEYEKEKGEIPLRSVVLVYTGWSKYWPDKMAYLGWNNSTQSQVGQPNTNFPGISTNAAKWLANERQIVGIGIDTPSVDPGNTQTYPVHVLFAEKQIYNIENVANLHNLIQSTNTSCALHLFVLPIKIIGGTGGPARILAYCK